MTQWLWIALGGAAGAVCRAGVTVWLAGKYPWATLVVNLTGSFLIGVILGLEGAAAAGRPALRFFLATGFCGAFTTFSTFSYQTLALLSQGQPTAAAINIAASVGGCLVAVWLGIVLANSLLIR